MSRSLPSGFAPHHLGPPPRRPQPQLQPQRPAAANGQYMGSYVTPPAAAAPHLMKRPAAAVPMQRDVYGAQAPSAAQRQTGVQQYAPQQFPPGSMQYGAQSQYMQGGYQPSQWSDSAADTSVESIAPQGYQAPGSFGANGHTYGGDTAVDQDRLSPAAADYSQYQLQHRGALQLLNSDTPRAPTSPSREGKKPSLYDSPPQVSRQTAPHAQRSAAPPPPAAADASPFANAGYKTDLDSDTSLIRSEADRIAQRLLKTEQELERLKKQGDLIGESLRKQKALDILAPLRTDPVPTLPGNFDAEQWLSQDERTGQLPSLKIDAEGTVPEVAPSMALHAASPFVDASPAPSGEKQASPKAASPPPQRAAAPVAQRAAAPLVQRAAAPPPPGAASPAAPPPQRDAAPTAPSPQRAAAPTLDYPQPPKASPVAPVAPKQPAAAHLNYPMPPTPQEQTKSVMSSLADIPNHPALKNVDLAKSVVDEGQAEALGLPKGSMWFDPNDPAQMQMIKEQLEGKPAEAPAGPAGPAVAPKPKKASRHSRLVKEDELPDYRQALHLPGHFDSQSQVIRCYKRLAPGLHPAVNQHPEAAAQLKTLTDCCQACLAELRKKSTSKVGELGTIGEEEEEELDEDGSPKKESGDGVSPGFLLVEDVDPLEFYDEIFFHKQKHAQLKVKMGVSVEDLVKGHAAGFDIERRIVNDKGEQGNFCAGCVPATYVLMLRARISGRSLNLFHLLRKEAENSLRKEAQY